VFRFSDGVAGEVGQVQEAARKVPNDTVKHCSKQGRSKPKICRAWLGQWKKRAPCG